MKNHLSALFALLIWMFAVTSNAFVIPSQQARRTQNTRLYLDLGSMFRNFGKKVTASHILIGPPESKTGRGMTQEDATVKLLELKEEIGDDPTKFAEAAKEFSSCGTASKGGDLGEFGPGIMIGPFDKVCFETGEVGVVNGPVSTNFGEHLIFIHDRTGDK